MKYLKDLLEETEKQVAIIRQHIKSEDLLENTLKCAFGNGISLDTMVTLTASDQAEDNILSRLRDISRYFPRPKGLFTKRCPKCGSKLHCIIHNRSYPNDLRQYTHYQCPNKDYEYVASKWGT